MNKVDFTYILEHPSQITSVQITELEKILFEFPYLQAARAIYLKGLFNQNSYRYNNELKKTAGYTTNRTVLFDFITSKVFKDVNNNINGNVKAIESQIIEDKTDNSLENSILKSIKHADISNKKNIINWEPTIHMIDPEHTTDFIDKASNLEEQKNESLVDFNRHESHSFSQWLQLTKMKPIDRTEDETIKSTNNEDIKKINKFDLIDKFIQTNPKIGSAKTVINSVPQNVEKSNQENSHLMTETLAKIYLEQKKYQKAIQAYEILILKYPEKSSLFAERIIEIKKIQNNNN